MKVIFPSVQLNSFASEKLCNAIRLNWVSFWGKCRMQFVDNFPQEQPYPFLTVEGVIWSSQPIYLVGSEIREIEPQWLDGILCMASKLWDIQTKSQRNYKQVPTCYDTVHHGLTLDHLEQLKQRNK